MSESTLALFLRERRAVRAASTSELVNNKAFGVSGKKRSKLKLPATAGTSGIANKMCHKY
ncbi:hypothetical protein BpHYR1_010550 [Brachionus plicatilis]|uniref:Uncharacterized protein n=1 Tax=Brachionus plicatilis TaxID=10195 RepID=A0A3M7T882_BRAPC|nr:hypothetical protein BpHYR1_010550 [Brachionus plicatilis]